MDYNEEQEILERAQQRINRPKLPIRTMSARQVCEELKITHTTLYRYIADGKLTKYRERHHTRYDRAEVERLKGETD